MPKLKEEIEIEFEVYCDTCGAGLCDQSKVVKTYNRGVNSVRVEVCDKCIQNAIEDTKYDMQKEINNLKETIENLEHLNSDLEYSIEQIERG